MLERSGHRAALVTGGAGFLGSHLCDSLIATGWRVICQDNLLTGRLENIAHLLAHPSFEFIERDICDGVPQINFDEIWNLACPASPPRYQADPVHTMMTSVLGARHCLELARKTQARVFQASTSEVYGDPLVHPQTETYVGAVNPIGPRACYDEGKRAAEALFFDYARTYGVQIKVARIFNTYGPRMDPEDGRVVSNFIVRALKGEPLELYGDGRQTRSFCYVDDLIDGFLRLMRSPDEITGPINIGNPTEFTVNELADLVLQMTGSKSFVTTTEAKVDDPKQRRPDIGRAASLLDWSPKIPLEAGLKRTITYFDAQSATLPEREIANAS
jgi:UDP-glucuronate decarboxylase